MSSRPIWTTNRVLGQSGLHRGTLSQTRKTKPKITQMSHQARKDGTGENPVIKSIGQWLVLTGSSEWAKQIQQSLRPGLHLSVQSSWYQYRLKKPCHRTLAV